MRPPNYVMAMTIGVLLALIGALLYVKRKSLEVLYNRDYWAIFALVCMTLINSFIPVYYLRINL